mgnify:FL=1
MIRDLEQFQAEFEPTLAQSLNGFPPQATELAEASLYSLTAGGKRIRPFLVKAAAEALGVTDSRWLIPALAVELLHTYSLVHDDLPAMDDDDLRRGKPTCHIAFNEATAILVGDGLQTRAFELLAEGTFTADLGIDPQLLNPEQRLQMVSVLGQAAGFKGMVSGQAIDLAATEDTDLDNRYKYLVAMHRHKTGALIEASLHLGALCLPQAKGSDLEALRQYGQAVGLAFQVKDDVLDVESDTATLGKPQGSDVENHKLTFPSLLGLEQARQKAFDLCDEAINSLEGFDHRAESLRSLAKYIVQRDH